VRALAASRHLRALEDLILEGNALGVEGAVALAESRNLRKLRGLDLDRCRIGDAGVWALLDSGNLPRLATLRVGNNSITPAGIRALAGARNLPRLRELDLCDWSGQSLRDLRIDDVVPLLETNRRLRLKLDGSGVHGSVTGSLRRRYRDRVCV
jgi:hypothetical protein